MSGMMDQVKTANETARGQANGAAPEPEEGVTPEAEVDAESPEKVEAAAPEETPETVEETPVKIGSMTFKNEEEAEAYVKKVDQLEREREVERAHTQGIRDALEAGKLNQPQTPVVQPEEDFDTEFYKDPKAAFKKVRESAISEAERRIEAKMTAEREWTSFLGDYPDIDRRDAERILNENWETIGILDMKTGRERLAQTVRSYYNGIIERAKPKTELSSGRDKTPSGQKSAGGKSVTPQREEKPLDFLSQVKQLKR